MRNLSPHTLQEPGRENLADIADVTEVDAHPVRRQGAQHPLMVIDLLDAGLRVRPSASVQ
jgi:hypothetical protein